MIFPENIKIYLMIDNKDSTPSSENPSILKWYEIVMLGKKTPHLNKKISTIWGFSNGILHENL